MIKKSTVFILGAGASKEINLPDGSQLKTEIAALLNFHGSDFKLASGNPDIHEAVRIYSRKNGIKRIDAYIHAAHSIRDAMPQVFSIDNYIDQHGGNDYVSLCGKLAIAKAILNAERNCSLYVNPANNRNKPDFSRISDSWFNRFFQIITENCQRDGLKDRFSKVKFIIFNYDRCFEQFLFHSLINVYRLNEEDAAEIINCVEIYHPYGSVGYLPWQHKKPSIEFGANVSPEKLLLIATELKTFTEGTNIGESEIVALRKTLAGAQFAIFLGFAFHKLNMELLFPAPLERNIERLCFATAFGHSESNRIKILSLLSGALNTPYELIQIRNDLKCFELLNEYSMSLSLE